MRPLVNGELEAASSKLYACWNSIGVRGDKTCPLLVEHVHCRNCPTFAAAATSLLDREVPERTSAHGEHYAEAHNSERPKDRSAIMFRIGREWLALTTLVLDEVVEMPALHSLPHRRSPIVLGLVNVRGDLLICVSFGKLLGIAEDEKLSTAKPRRLLIVRGNGGRFAMPVDDVQHTHRYHDGEVLAAPATIARSETTFTRSLLPWRNVTCSILDDVRLFDSLDRSLA
jgi:chemotaxis-related protein WspD